MKKIYFISSILFVLSYTNAQNNVIGIFDPLNISGEFQQSLNVVSPDSFEVFNSIEQDINDYSALFLFLGEAENPIIGIYSIDSIESENLINYLEAGGKIFICNNYIGSSLNQVNFWEYIGIETETILLPVFDISFLHGLENTIMEGININYNFTANGIPIINQGDECILDGRGGILDYFILHQFESDTVKVLFSYRNVIHFHPILQRVLDYFGLAYIPVELISFTSNVDENSVTLNWETSSETNNMGFEVERTRVEEKKNWKKIVFVEGSGTTLKNKLYSFTDKYVSVGRYEYRLKQIDFDGSFEYSNEIEVTILQPDNYSLGQNYPNPFNPSTKIKFYIPEKNHVAIKVYDILGNEIAVLINEVKNAGSYEIEFPNSNTDISSLSSGVYFYHLHSGNFSQIMKMTLIK